MEKFIASTCIYHSDMILKTGEIMPRINKTKYAILGLLHYQPMSGYDIKKMSDSSIGYFWQENYGHIYPVLKKLEIEKLAISKKEESEGTPPRIVYSITKKGKEEFQKWMKQGVDTERFRLELLLKVFFGIQVNEDEIKRHLHDAIDRNRKMLDEYKKLNEHLEETHKNESGKMYWMFTAKFGVKYAKMQIEWCEECLEDLEQG